jgi:hypothetical protein
MARIPGDGAGRAAVPRYFSGSLDLVKKKYRPERGDSIMCHDELHRFFNRFPKNEVDFFFDRCCKAIERLTERHGKQPGKAKQCIISVVFNDNEKGLHSFKGGIGDYTGDPHDLPRERF